MAKICTSVEQSKKLVKLGLDVNTADAIYPWRELMKDYDSLYVPENMFDIDEDDIPAWSLSALLELLPQHIDSGLGWQKFGLDKGWNGGIYQVYYENKNSFIEKKSQTAVDAAFEMICWLLEQGFIKKG